MTIRTAARFIGTMTTSLAALALLFNAATALAYDLQPDPDKAGMNPDRLTALRPTLESFVAQKQIAGAVTVVGRRGQVASVETVGLADVESGRPMRRDTLFRIASMTKPITALGIMILRDEGKLAIHDPVYKHIPSFAGLKMPDGSSRGEVVTLQHLLTHTSGLSGDSPTTADTLERFVDVAASKPLRFEPGERWEYSNTGIAALGRVIEVASGMRYEDFLRQRIFEPLGLKDTTFLPNNEQRSRLAVIYEPDGGVGQGIKRAYADTGGNPDWLRMKFGHPAGGLYSTAPDLARLYQMMLDEGELDGLPIVSHDSMRMMRQRYTGELVTGFTPGMGWGLGVIVVRRPQTVTSMLRPGTFGHGGAFGTQGWMDVERDMFFIYLVARANFPDNSDSSSLRGIFQQIAVDAIER